MAEGVKAFNDAAVSEGHSRRLIGHNGVMLVTAYSGSSDNSTGRPLRMAVLLTLLVLVLAVTMSACGDDPPAEQGVLTSDVTSVSLVRVEGEQRVRAQIKNPLSEAASFVVTVSFASSEGTKTGETTVPVNDVPAGAKKSGNSSPLSPTVPVGTLLIVSGVEQVSS